MAMIQSFPTGSGSGGTSKISQKSGNSLVNITGSTNPNEDGLYSEDLTYKFDRINYAQKIVNKPGREELISAPIILPKFNKPATAGTSAMTQLGVTATLNNDINNYDYIDISLQPSSTARKRIPQTIRLRVSDVVYNNTTSEDSADGSMLLLCYDIDTTIGFGGQYHANIKAWFKDSTNLYLFQGSTSIADENWRDWVITNITGVITESTIVDPVAYLSKDGNLEETPVGSIISYTGNKVPAHYLLCNGSEYNIADYPELAKHFKDDLGAVNYFGGDGITTFAVPSKPLKTSVLKLNPTMTSNTTPEGQVIYNNLYEDFRPYMAFGDSNNPSEKDCYVAHGKPSYLGYKFANPTVITAYSLQPRGYLDMNTISGTPSDWELQASNDMTNWVTLDTQSGITWTSTSDIQVFCFNNTTAYQAYRIYVTNSANKNSLIIIGNLKFGTPEIKEASYIKYETTHKVFFGDQTTYKVSVPFTRKSGSTFQDIIFDNANAEDDISMLGTNKLIAPMDGYYAISYFTKQFSGNAGIYDTSIYVDGVNVSSDTGSLSTGTGIASTSSIVIKLKKNQEVTFTIWSQYNIPQINGTITMALVNTLNENKVLELMNKPNLWVTGQEYDFGDGVYGKRIQHNGTTKDVLLLSASESSNTTKIFSWGGSFRNSNNNVWSLPAAGDGMNLIELWRDDHLSTYSWHLEASNNGSEWDVWILYTK